MLNPIILVALWQTDRESQDHFSLAAEVEAVTLVSLGSGDCLFAAGSTGWEQEPG